MKYEVLIITLRSDQGFYEWTRFQPDGNTFTNRSSQHGFTEALKFGWEPISSQQAVVEVNVINDRLSTVTDTSITFRKTMVEAAPPEETELRDSLRQQLDTLAEGGRRVKNKLRPKKTR